MGAHLRSALPNFNVVDNVVEDEIRVIEVKRRFINCESSIVILHFARHSLIIDFLVASEVESSTVFIEVLRILSNLGFQLDATVPLSRKGSLGIRTTRELLVFRGITTTS